MHYSLYYENYKNDNFESARSDLLWILENAPGTPDGDDDNYRRVVNLYVGLAEQASSESERKAYLDTAATHLTSAPEKMKKEYGDKLTLWTGVQCETLINGTREDVEKEVRRYLDICMPEGGFIFGSTNSVQYGANTDNYLRALEIVREKGIY